MRFWNADHTRPLFESTGDPAYFGPDNLQALCTACHNAKMRPRGEAPRTGQKASGQDFGRTIGIFLMAKRFTDSEKWNDPWFRRLSPELKCFWSFVLDRCDAAGVWKVDMDLASFNIGRPLTEEEVLKAMPGRFRKLDTERWWVTKFIPFQYGELNEACRPHAAVLRSLKEHGLFKEYSKGIHTLKDKDQVQDKDKDQDKDKERGVETELFPPSLDTADFRAKWAKWEEHRRGLKKPRDWRVLFGEQILWLSKFPTSDAIEILSASIRNGYTGLFPPNGSNGNGHHRRPETAAERKAERAKHEYALTQEQLDNIPTYNAMTDPDP